MAAIIALAPPKPSAPAWACRAARPIGGRSGDRRAQDAGPPEMAALGQHVDQGNASWTEVGRAAPHAIVRAPGPPGAILYALDPRNRGSGPQTDADRSLDSFTRSW